MTLERYAPACAVGIATGVFAWVIAGWPEADARRFVQSVANEARMLGLASRQLVKRIGHMLTRFPSAQRDGSDLREISEMVDIVRLGLMAGLSFDASLELYCANRSSPLARRLERARLSWQVGTASREEALLDAARDLDARPLESFALTVSQALRLGAPLAMTLEGLSREARAAHRAHIERHIERAPVKMLIPTGTLILPALLLSILGPLLAAGGMI